MLVQGDGRIVSAVRAVLVDLDGVVYAGERALPGAAEFFATLQRLGVAYAFLTNNTTRTPEHYAARLAQLGIAVDRAQIVTAAEAAAGVIARERPAARVYVIGEDGLRSAFQRRGFVLTGEAADYVVVGLDRSFDYEKLRLGTAAIRRGAQFVASNADALLPTDDDFVPGAGAMVGALVGATGVAPRVIGKPKPDMLLLALEPLGVLPREAMMIGDRLDTDIAAGRAAGMYTALVLSGVARAEDLPAAPVQPDLVAEHLGALASVFARYRGEGARAE
ncbi:MAG: HAD-IIA family hydrolase [Chloroflexi bacterium]|nr:HAD-IIA family hydrolase [Chloroflexota bacterium]